MEEHVHIDFETRSECDLRKAGSYLYSCNPTTRVLCVGVAIGNHRPKILSPKNFGKMIPALRAKKIVAHNAFFELDIWNNCGVRRYDWPELNITRVSCTMVRAYALGLPGGLDAAAAAVGLEVRKDLRGKRIMMQLCKPRRDGSYYQKKEHPEKFRELYAYCLQDVEVERELDKRLPLLSPYEQKVWETCWRINQRGLQIDVKAAKVVAEMIDHAKERNNKRMDTLTDGLVPTCTANHALLSWLQMEGIEADSVDKASVLEILAGNPPKRIRRVLELRQKSARSSTAKIKMMLQSAAEDGRIRGAFQYHAASTGRWGGRLIQPHNLPRPKISQEQIEEVFEVLHA